MTPHLDPPPRGEIDVGTVPPPRRAAAGSPPRFFRPRRRGHPLSFAPHQRPSRSSSAPGLPGRAMDPISVLNVPLARPAECGAGQRLSLPRPLVSGQVGAEEGPGRGKPRAGSVVGPDRVFDNPVVGHASISNSRVCVVVARTISLRTRGETSGLPVEGRNRVDPQSKEWAARNVARRRGPRHRREV
jgi:hypothetical protein